MYYEAYNICRNKMYENNCTKARRGNVEGCCCKVLILYMNCYYLKVDCDRLKYTVNPNTISKVTQQKVIFNKPKRR